MRMRVTFRSSRSLAGFNLPLHRHGQQRLHDLRRARLRSRSRSFLEPASSYFNFRTILAILPENATKRLKGASFNVGTQSARRAIDFHFVASEANQALVFFVFNVPRHAVIRVEPTALFFPPKRSERCFVSQQLSELCFVVILDNQDFAIKREPVNLDGFL